MSNVVLVIAAHSDDEVLGCGGTIAKHIANGDKVTVMYMTDGVSSRALKKGAIDRENASFNAMKILGVQDIRQSDFPDNKMDSVPLLDIAKDIETVLSDLTPNIIYTHFAYDLNIDHRVTHTAVMTACRPQSWSSVKRIYTFEVLSSTEWNSYSASKFNPNMFIDVSKTWDKKMLAMQQYSQELRPFPHSRCIEAIESLGTLRGVCVGLEKAEAFQIERVIK